jgi:hypothetical protein
MSLEKGTEVINASSTASVAFPGASMNSPHAVAQKQR